MSIRKSLLALSLLTASHALYAANTAEPHFRTGMYLGLMEGLSAGQTKMSENYRPDPRDIAAGAENYNASKSISRSAFVSEVMVGGRYLMDNGFFPGFEVAASFANHKFENDFVFHDTALNNFNPLFPAPAVSPAGDNIFRAAIKRRYSFVPSVVLGWAFSQQFNVFAKLGLGITKYDVRILNDTFDGGVGFNTPYFRGSQGKTYYSFVPALGIEYSFNRYVSFVASASYEVGQKPEFTNSHLVEQQALPINDSNRLSGRVSIFTQKIGLLFKF